MFASGAGARDTSATGSIFSGAGLGAISGVASGVGAVEIGSGTCSTGRTCFGMGFFSGTLATFFSAGTTFSTGNSLADSGGGATIRAALALDGAARVALSVRADGTPSD